MAVWSAALAGVVGGPTIRREAIRRRRMPLRIALEKTEDIGAYSRLRTLIKPREKGDRDAAPRGAIKQGQDG